MINPVGGLLTGGLGLPAGCALITSQFKLVGCTLRFASATAASEIIPLGEASNRAFVPVDIPGILSDINKGSVKTHSYTPRSTDFLVPVDYKQIRKIKPKVTITVAFGDKIVQRDFFLEHQTINKLNIAFKNIEQKFLKVKDFKNRIKKFVVTKFKRL